MPARIQFQLLIDSTDDRIEKFTRVLSLPPPIGSGNLGVFRLLGYNRSPMSDGSRIFEADLTWTGSRFEAGVQVAVRSDGKIERISAASSDSDSTILRWRGAALLPGFVNAHSHAFQRGLRGRGERFPSGAGSFWSWREEMYSLVSELDEEAFYHLCLECFQEMLAAGITTVGEFHYLHHRTERADFRFDPVVVRAAADAGIRLVLLQAYYRTGGVGRPLEGTQRRFSTPTPEVYWEQMDQLGRLLDPTTQTLGAVVHSIRAAPVEDIEEIHREARRRGLVFHMHVEEQRQEIEQCRTHYRRGPLELLNRRLDIDAGFTAVHCTHSSAEDLAPLLRAGGNVCICPLTEANLGDGIADLPAVKAARGHLCLGTDSNARLCFLEEARWLEYAQRLQREQRGVWADQRGDVARRLLESATREGARALGLRSGRIEAGLPADFIRIDLEHPSLHGWTPDNLLDSLIFGCGNSVIQAVYVAGRQVSERRAQRE